jgi:DNA-binding Lrp family transcriptional regulator
VNKPEAVKIEGPFEAQALRILRDTPGLSVISRERKQAGNHRADALVRFAGTRANIALEMKRRVNAAMAWQLVHKATEHPDVPVLVIAGETTAEARQILQNHGLALVDGLRNAHIALPGLYFHIEGHRPPRRFKTDGAPARLSGKAAVAAQALLLHANRAWQVHEIAKEARISPTLAHRILARLEAEGIVATEGSGPNRVRRVTNLTALLDLYAEENSAAPIRTLAYALAQTPRELIRGLATNLERAEIEYAVTGAAAASLVAPFITAIPITEVWVTMKKAREELCDGAQAKPVTDGANIVFLQTKGDTPLVLRERTKELWLVNRFQLYTDLRRDPRRGREQADHLRREVIGF